MPDSGANQYWQSVTDVYFILMVACGVIGMGIGVFYERFQATVVRPQRAARAKR